MTTLQYTGPHAVGSKAPHKDAVPPGEIAVIWVDELGGGISETTDGVLECTPDQAKHLLEHQPDNWQPHKAAKGD
jgi:hypothetical protein